MRKNVYKLPEGKRREAVDEYLDSDSTAAEVAARYGIAEVTLYRWRRDFYPPPPQQPLPASLLPQGTEEVA